MQFVHQPLAWGFLLILVPLLIHLINMLRHRRVQWAAMDFLLQSYKKHRKWIWLKQLLLLLMRMAVVALLVAMLAQWVTQGQWLDIFGGKATHHYVLLDDSYSMSDRSGGSSAYERALSVVQRIGSQAAVADTPQKITLIRFSRADRGNNQAAEDPDYEQITDFNAEIVDAGFDVVLEEKRNTFEVTQLSLHPTAALASALELAKQSGDENRVVYVISDFRKPQWEAPAEIRDLLRELEQTPADIRLVGTVRSQRQNLAITDIQPANETQAAGVPLPVNVTVKNHGPEVARNVQLRVNTVFYDPMLEQAVTPNQLMGDTKELPTILINEIEPGQTVTRRAQAFFPEPGRHVVEAILPDDPVTTDNRRWCVIDFPDSEAVLVIDGSPDQRHAYYLESAFQPGGRANTGIRSEVKSAAFFRDVTAEVLQGYRVIYLLDVPRFDARAIDNLEQYVSSGGGLCFFLGPEVDLSFYRNQLYRAGTGLFPLPLEQEDFLLSEPGEAAPDVEVTDHPVFGVFLGERNPLIRLITIGQFLRPPLDWRPAPDSNVEVAAWLRNRSPLAVERRFGEGRVLAILTTLAADWNNWANDPSFVVVALKLQSHLAAAQRTVESRPVGAPVSVQLEADAYRQDVLFATPGGSLDARLTIERVAAKAQGASPVMTASIGTETTADGGETDRAGVYEIWPVTTAGKVEVRRLAMNVEPSEGTLGLVGVKSLLQTLDPVKADFRFADQIDYDPSELSGYNRSLLLMCLLIGLLVLEQLVAFATSYHPRSRNGHAAASETSKAS